jgi:hypothetical protein
MQTLWPELFRTGRYAYMRTMSRELHKVSAKPAAKLNDKARENHCR